MKDSAKPQQTMQQQRAAHALKAVKEWCKNPEGQKELKSYAAAFPAMIKMNGLGQAAAFYYSQGAIHRELYSVVCKWLTLPGQPYHSKEDLLAGITQQGMADYLNAQIEALLLLDWVKRFAKAFLAQEEQNSASDL